MVIAIHDNGTYSHYELDGTRLKIPVARKRVKTFRRKDSKFTPNDLSGVADFDFDEQENQEACEQNEDLQFGTYQRMCKFGGDECRDTNFYKI